MELLTYLLEGLVTDEVRRRHSQFRQQKIVNQMKDNLNAAHRTGDDRAEASLLIELGNVYTRISQYTMADAVYQQAIAISHQIPDPRIEIVAHVY